MRMNQNNKTRIAGLVALILLVIGIYSVYLATQMTINRRADRLAAEIAIQHWAERLINQDGVGRNCSIINYSDVNAIFEARGQKRPAQKPGILDYSGPCWKQMKLSELRYYADYDVVSGVYRCEKDEIVQELQLAIYLAPRSVPQKDDCKVGAFPKDWQLPVGEATMFSLP